MIDVFPETTISVLADESQSVAVNSLPEPVVAVNLSSSVAAISWDAIEGKPQQFPPTPHSHLSADISDLHTQTIRGGKFVG
jgi:hypothetical protein